MGEGGRVTRWGYALQPAGRIPIFFARDIDFSGVEVDDTGMLKDITLYQIARDVASSLREHPYEDTPPLSTQQLTYSAAHAIAIALSTFVFRELPGYVWFQISGDRVWFFLNREEEE
jgi:hypothetical protein